MLSGLDDDDADWFAVLSQINTFTLQSCLLSFLKPTNTSRCFFSLFTRVMFAKCSTAHLTSAEHERGWQAEGHVCSHRDQGCGPAVFQHRLQEGRRRPQQAVR